MPDHEPTSPEREGLFFHLFDASPFPAVVSRLDDGVVLGVNARAAELVGVSPHDAVGSSVLDYYVDRAERDELIDRLRRDGRSDERRLRIRRANGEPFWVLASSRLVRWQTDVAALTVFHDISAQLAAETQLREGERRLIAQSDALTGLTARYTNPDERFDQ